jgi:hypothetical protein
MRNMIATTSPTVFVLTDWNAEKKSNTSLEQFMVDVDPPNSSPKKWVPILYGVQEWERSNWEAAQINPITADYIDTKQLILVFDGSDPWSGQIEVFDRLGPLKFNQIIDKVVHVMQLENWLRIGGKIYDENAKDFPDLKEELQIIGKQIADLKEKKVDLPRCVKYLSGHVEHLLFKNYECSDQEKEQVISNVYSSRRTPLKTEELCGLIEDKKFKSKAEMIEKTSEGLI